MEPLAAILEVAYHGTQELEARRTELLEAIALTRKDGEEFVSDHRILRELGRLATANDPLVGSASELASKCELNPRPSTYEIAGALRRYGFENRSIRIGESVRYRYELPRGQLAETCARFVCGPSEPEILEGVPSLAGFANEPD